MLAGIYQLQNVATGQIYIGRSVNVPRRLEHHFWKLRNRRHSNRHLQASFDKYGRTAFIGRTVLVCRVEDLPLYEKLAIKAFDAGNREVGFNQMTVGDDGHYVHTEEAKQKTTVYNLERWKDPDYRALRSEQQRETITKQWADPAFQQLRSASASEQWNDPARRAQFAAKRSISATAMWQDPDYREKRHDAALASWQKPDRKAAHHEKMKALWRDPEYRANVMAGRARARAAKAGG